MSDEFQQQVDKIEQKFRPELDQIEAEGRKISEDAKDPNAVGCAIGIDFDVEMKEKTLSFDLPTVTMRNRELSLHLPIIKKNRQRIVFDIPTMTMETYCAFKRPVVRWPKVKMECVYLDKPVFRMKRHEIIYDLPSVTMERKSFTLKVPEFGSKTHTIILKIPQFTVKKVRVETEKLQRRGEELRERGEAIAKRMEAEVQALIATFFGSASIDQIGVRQEVENSYSGAIGQVEGAISELDAQKVDASKIPAEGGNVNLRKVLVDLIEERDRAVKTIDEGAANPRSDDLQEAA
jgi:hypothetical protein